MLPFLNKAKSSVAGLIVAKRKPDGGMAPSENPTTESDASLHAICEDMIQAFHSKDAPALASALRAAFLALEAEPNEEGFDEQNEAAASQE